MKQDFLQIVTDLIVLKFIIAFNCFVAFDTITGLVKAWTNKNIQSTKLRHGVEKYIIYWVFVLLGAVIDFAIVNNILENHNMTTFNVVSKTFCMIVCGVELLSLQENFKEWNLNIPDWVIKLFNKGNGDERPLKTLDFEEDNQLTLEELQELLDEE